MPRPMSAADGDPPTDTLAQLRLLVDPMVARLPYHERLGELLGRTQRVCAVDIAGLLLLDELTDGLVVAGSVGFADESEAAVSLARESGLAGRVAGCEAVIVVEDTTELQEISPSLAQLGITSAAAAPVCVDAAVVGVLIVGDRTERVFDAGDLAAIELAADRLALDVEHHRVSGLDRRREARLFEADQAATAQLRFLAKASGLLLSSLDYETTLRTLADAAVPEIADWCAIDMVTPNGGVRRLAVAHVDPAKVALAHELQELYPFDPDAPAGLAKVLRSGQLEHLPVITDELLVASAPSAEWLAVMRSLGLASAVTVPLTARGRTLGAITLVMAESGRSYGDVEVAAIEELALLAGVAVDNAQLFHDRSEVARALQSSLLPPSLPEIPRLELAARYLPSGLQAEVGGDFYDVFRDVGGQWAFVIGDVCGKGPEAAAVTGLARHTLRAVAQHDPAPGAVLEAVNAVLVDQAPAGRFCTIGYARVDVGTDKVAVTVASGGHPLALVRRPSGLVEAVGRPGMLVGVVAPVICPEDVAVLGPGDALLLYTDGLVERHQAAGGVEDGEPALRAVLSRCDGLDADAIADLVLSVALDQPEGARDDVAVLVLRVAEADPAP